MMGSYFFVDFVSHNRRTFSVGLPQGHRPTSSNRTENLLQVSACSFRDRSVLRASDLARLLTPFIEGGDGPKLIDLLQMREKYLLQDRIELLGPIHPRDVRSVRSSVLFTEP